jgi:hypothetical protein
MHPQESEILAWLETSQDLNLSEVINLSDVEEVAGGTVISKQLVPR